MKVYTCLELARIELVTTKSGRAGRRHSIDAIARGGRGYLCVDRVVVVV